MGRLARSRLLGLTPPRNAGLNGNRTSFRDVMDGGAPWVVSYCHDDADRLIATKVSGAPADVSPVLGRPLNSQGSEPSLAYDAQGNITKIGDQTLVWDGGDRHVETRTSDGTKVVYTRDADDRLVKRVHTDPKGEVVTTRYGFTGAGDTADLTLDESGRTFSKK